MKATGGPQNSKCVPVYTSFVSIGPLEPFFSNTMEQWRLVTLLLRQRLLPICDEMRNDEIARLFAKNITHARGEFNCIHIKFIARIIMGHFERSVDGTIQIHCLRAANENETIADYFTRD